MWKIAVVIAMLSWPAMGAEFDSNGGATFDLVETVAVVHALKTFAAAREEYQEQVAGILNGLIQTPIIDRRSRTIVLLALSWDSRNPASCALLLKITPKSVCMTQ